MMIDVRGTTTIAGWKVSLHDAPIPIDRQRRFSGRQPHIDIPSVAIRFDHPQRGTHYLVRRLRP
jgi:hypothetical protein